MDHRYTKQVLGAIGVVGPPLGSKYIFVQFYVSSGRFWKVLCSSVNEFQQILNASSREDYIPQALTGLLEILRVYI